MSRGHAVAHKTRCTRGSPTRFWPSRRVVLAAVVVGIGTVLVFRGLAGQPADHGSGSGPPGTVVASPSLAAPTAIATASPTATESASPTASATPKPVACIPTDQDRYVWHPQRLLVKAACIRVTGVIQAVSKEADGDLHLRLALDPQFTSLLTPANQGVEQGDLVIEPVCVRPVTLVVSIAICASDHDPLAPPFPVVGDRVWMEGRYVLDLAHGGWAELHPLYRWGGR